MNVYKKILVSGSVVEVYDYSSPVWIMKDSKSSTASINPKDNLRRLVSSNLYRWRAESGKAFKPLFLTLTLKEQKTSITSARLLYKLFMVRFASYRKKFDGGVNRYVSVMELTKAGVPHFHIMFFNLPFIPNFFYDVSKIWGKGYVLHKVVNGSGLRTAEYMAKYLIKQDKGQGRRYMASKGLLRPVTLYDESDINAFMSFMLEYDFYEVMNYQYPSRIVGNVSYRRYIVKDNDFNVWSAIHYFVDETYPIL